MYQTYMFNQYSRQELCNTKPVAIRPYDETINIGTEMLQAFKLTPEKLRSQVHKYKSKILEQCQLDLERFQMFIDGAPFPAKDAYDWICKGLKPYGHNFSTGYTEEHLAILAALLAQGFLNPVYKIEVELKQFLVKKGIVIKSAGSLALYQFN